jgi:uncharacterized protein involved in type VI secretion and phage assembly
VIRVRHVFSEKGEYFNEFDAVPEKFNRIPFPDLDIPVAHAIPATVTDNEDPDGLGKVQVRFDFEDKYNDYWMPVMMPEAGGPENRGYIFVPEKNDMVLVSFFDGNPEFPFVMGSMFHGKNGKGIGGGAGNHIKSMRDKIGSEVVLNTQDGSIKLFSPKGNSTVFIDGKGNISLSTPNTITLSSKDLVLLTANKIKMDSLPTIVPVLQNSTSGGNSNEGILEIKTKKTINIESEEETITIKAKKNISAESTEAEIILKAKTNVKIEAPTQVEIQTPDMQVKH